MNIIELFNSPTNKPQITWKRFAGKEKLNAHIAMATRLASTQSAINRSAGGNAGYAKSPSLLQLENTHVPLQSGF